MVEQTERLMGGVPQRLSERQAMADRSGGGVVSWETADPEGRGARIRLWDNVDNSWAKPVERGAALQHYIKKLTFKCSTCTFTTAFEGGVDSHIRMVGEDYEAHKNAELIDRIQEGTVRKHCTGCGILFENRKNKPQRHMEGILQAYPRHKNASGRLIRRFSLGPPVSAQEVSTNGAQPNGTQVEERRSRGRRRHRGRRRR